VGSKTASLAASDAKPHVASRLLRLMLPERELLLVVTRESLGRRRTASGQANGDQIHVLTAAGGARFLPFLLLRGSYGSVKALVQNGPVAPTPTDRGTHPLSRGDALHRESGIRGAVPYTVFKLTTVI
jgi:hypothetical protein